MQALIPVVDFQIGDAAVPAVNARELHAFLGAGKKFPDWIKERIAQYGFTENKDFVALAESDNFVQKGFSLNREKPLTGRPSKDFMISLAMAKELAMVERNDKGKQARLYFIACEQRMLQQASQAALPAGDAIPPGCPRFNGVPVLTNQQLQALLQVSRHTVRSNRILRPGRFKVGVHFFNLSGEPLRNFTLDNINNGVFTRRGGRRLTIWSLAGVEAHLQMLPPSTAEPARQRLQRFLAGEAELLADSDSPTLPPLPALSAPVEPEAVSHQQTPSTAQCHATLCFPSATAFGLAMPDILSLMQRHGAQLAEVVTEG
ncbi:antA/AntB antirepressor family protein [Aquitalea sp. LB_tupeE]|uniref:antA/AntB antirepressor family protein n=1 Tax=Aquitalea sp. LB_tupeE TaxID=2748078 RepID=UPI0015B7F5E0|nr:antA/AntB antirepressor family protein [Aquitalea sp. LB_tupeE]NWK80311.1 antA/AntB antirepressor family protein [Aquitalea sp. LB_tupeE]